MTRINLGIHPSELCDQHLVAEYREFLEKGYKMGFIFFILIPFISGVLTETNVASHFIAEELPIAIVIDISICILSTIIGCFLTD